jgi:serine/threonine protein kinase
MTNDHEPKAPAAGTPPDREVPKSVIAEPLATLLLTGAVGPPPQPGLLGVVDKYELLGLLGQGGMGVVFLAREANTGQQVALKLPRPELGRDAELLDRFLRESRRLQQLKHTHLVPVLEAKEIKGTAFFVMPYFDGGSLARRIQPDQPLASAEILRILIPVVQALKAIHSAGFTHRDIKPANVLLGRDGSVCLADFGLARTVLNDSVIQPGKEQFEGTPHYMSPQMARGETEDTRCDIYAVGALLYEMLTGSPPYQGQTTREIRDKIIAGPPKPISQLNPRADLRLSKLAKWAMAREQRERYANMADLAEDLRRVSSGGAPIGPHSLTHRRPWSSLAKAKHAPSWIAAGSLLVLAVAWLLWHSGLVNSPWEARSLSLPQVIKWYRAQPVNWPNLPGTQLLVPADYRFLAVSVSGGEVRSWPDFGPFDACLEDFIVTESEEQGRKGLIVSWAKGTHLGMVELNDNLFEVNRFETLGAEQDQKDHGPASGLFPLCTLSSRESHDGRKKVIASVRTGYSRKPRGLCCFDYTSRQLEWQRLVGPMLNGLEMLDLDGDGFKDFVCGCISPDNHNVAEDGTDDGHAYLFAWSNDGKLLWRTNLSGAPSGTDVLTADLASNGHKEILALVSRTETAHDSNESMPSKVLQLDYTGHVVRSYQPGSCLQTFLVADLNGDGRVEIICSDCFGDIHVLGPELNLLNKVRVINGADRRPGKVDGAQVRLIAAKPFLQPGKLNLLALCLMHRQDSAENLGDHRTPMDKQWDEHPKLLVLDANLKVLASYPLKARIPVVRTADIEGDGLDEILCLSDHVDILKLKR